MDTVIPAGSASNAMISASDSSNCSAVPSPTLSGYELPTTRGNTYHLPWRLSAFQTHHDLDRYVEQRGQGTA